MRRKANPVIWIAAALAVILGALWQQSDTASAKPSSRWRLEEVRDARERAQLVEVLRQIEKGGPFRYEKDGSVFGNREKLLPSHPRGYYREYTVPTPGAKNRGARRVVQGRGGETYYTRDHYRTFLRLDAR